MPTGCVSMTTRTSQTEPCNSRCQLRRRWADVVIMGCIRHLGADWNEPVLPADVGGCAQKRDETRPPSLNQHEPSVSPPSLRRGSSMQLQPSEEEKQRRRDAGSPTDREIRQRKDTWTDRTDSRSCCSQTDRVKGRPSTENPHVRLPSERNRAAPYSRSSSSYNSLYLLLLNLKEKTGFRNKKMPIYCTDT